MQDRSSNSPGVISLIWDNFQTTAFFGGAIAAPVPAMVGGLSFAAMGLLGGECGTGFVGGGFLGGLAVGVPVGILSGMLFAVPFAISAAHTRKFLANAEINPLVTLLSNCIDDSDKQRIIDEIIKEDDESNSCVGVRSIESLRLKQFIKNEFLPYEMLEHRGYYDAKRNVTCYFSQLTDEARTNYKWNAILAYMKEKTFFGDGYVNNGKKLFNSILKVFRKYQLNTAFRLRLAVLTNNTAMLDEIINRAALTHCNIIHEKKILLYAVINNRPEIVRHLLAHHLNKTNIDSKLNDVNNPNSCDKTPLYIATECGFGEVTRALFDANAQACVGTSSIHPIVLAASKGHLAIVMDLLTSNPELLNITDNKGMSLLMYAAQAGHFDIVKFLVSNKAATNTTVTDGSEKDFNKNALQLAEAAHHEKIADYLGNIGVYDPNTIKLRNELAKVMNILDSRQWSDRGWGLFGNHTPTRIAALQGYADSFRRKNIDAMNRQTLRQIKAELQQIVNFALATRRAGDQGELYALINNLGNNSDTAFDRLEACFGRIALPPVVPMACMRA